ncbi:TetR/AcrR family transcriptional regulator [Streptomyces rapamycinicus]|uniref:TetR family transcriptional regulator n=2 Tax=Streptomyces rapamycinicus TaxID=1226757 RepID=A0A0A0NMC3_STRRN|nr:TetR/AcrR family transcriptional regulator [Streptomyces rapamycinicus]AGP55515.1 TetR family transcriptional regulator [Streptomyces rapamycinicus NRRL 5491]MBB4783078.1 AcrR family transcriptional regulator [Streptomyces rapamycinicus]RLV81447.1 TetR family transcriptional regulator [Streptomyces rapamycinicus NRRL 5491]UTO63523.1 TetR/AcrR family transcriptional regulator [Streptomyces rapamycinicus]UTP31480.1 TetR/AcrR family transcriptional regulator [Streptomyces rapamycinicus NRRL 54
MRTTDPPTEDRDTARVRRSRLSPERERELYEAVVELLGEVGYDGLTMDAVAARTRSSKATLYRQWKGKPQLVATALRHTKPVLLEGVDTGSLRGDLREIARCSETAHERDAALMRGLAHASHDNPDLHQALRELLIFPEINALHALLRRAVDRGEVAPDRPALNYVVHMMCGAFITRPLVEGKQPDQTYLLEYIDAVILPALGAA